MVRKSEAYNLADGFIADGIGSGLAVLMGEGATKSHRNLDSRGLNSSEDHDIENSTPEERGCRYWKARGVTFAV
jgi:hypothetical protein